MSDRLEDLYVKGFMAFNAKDFKSAQSFWSQVLAEDPNHEKARQGMTKLKELASKNKRSSKDVFQDIKKLYAAKEFAEALRLTNLLLKKHPENQDLLGLQQKLSARLKPAAAPVPAKPEFDGRSTMYMASAAELSVLDTAADEAEEQQVEKLIQEGVSLYELQDYAMAIRIWQKALEIEPGNRIASEYVKNVSALLSQEEDRDEEPELEPVAPPAPSASVEEPSQSDKPSKEQMLSFYNEAMALFKDRRYDAALEKWNYILQFYPSHAETLQCVEKTNALLEKEAMFKRQLGEALDSMAQGSLSQAESLLTRLSIEAPQLTGLAEAQAELEKARAAATSSTKRDQDFSTAPAPKASTQEPDSQEDHSATDDQITSFFNEKTETASARKVVTSTIKKKNKQPINIFKVFGGLVAVAAVAIAGYFGYTAYSKRMVKSVELKPVAISEINWNSDTRVVEDFLNFGNDFEEESDFMMAAFAYQRVIAIGTPRLEQLQKDLASGSKMLETDIEIATVREKLSKAKVRLAEVTRKIRGDQVPPNAQELAQAEMRRAEYQSAAENLNGLLASDPTNESVREMLGKVNERLAFEMLKKNDLSTAMRYFKRASVLLVGYDASRRHLEVIQRFFNGTINETDKNQWFFFFE